MSNVAEILQHALALPPGDRASLAQSLLHSLPAPPKSFSTADELGEELHRRIERIRSQDEPLIDFAETMRKAREAVKQVRS